MTIEEEIKYLKNKMIKITGIPEKYQHAKKTDNVSAKGLETIKSQHSYPEIQ